MDEERYCTECRALIPERESVCPACGVFAGDVFDGKLPKKRRSWTWLWLTVVLVAACVAGWIYLTRPENRVEDRRPRLSGQARRLPSTGNPLTILRRFLTTPDRDETCVALIAKGTDGGKTIITAFDRCKHVKLGDFAVDPKTAKVTKR